MPKLLDVIVCCDIYQGQYFIGPSQGQREQWDNENEKEINKNLVHFNCK